MKIHSRSKKLSLAIFALLAIPSICISQKKEDVLYLKNGWVLRGEKLESAEHISIQTREGNIFRFTIAEVERMTVENAWAPDSYKQSGFSHYTEMGALAAQNNSDANVNTSAFSFQTVNGYKWTQYAFTGIGLGVDLYATETFIPLFFSFRGDIRKKGNVIPFYFFDGGYGFNITGNADPQVENNGGRVLAGGIGIKVPFQNNTAFLVSAGYRQQRSSTVSESLRNEANYERLALRAGFSF
jgi:hypothetical protein